ncbi:MAG TPA: bifunctional DNA primase/polymerase [Chloroflexota bacterium]|jgi:hypothetical protein
MFAPATVGGARLPTDPLDALKLYTSLGLRCFPATYADKTPHPRVGKWGTLFNYPIIPADKWAVLTRGWGRFNVAVCCHEHLVVIDLDNLDFVAWFDAQGPERLGTWIVRSPSGGLHVYAYSDEAQNTTVIKAVDGVKIGDVKARGGYVIAPPSVGPNGDYQTEYGSPETIIRQPNAVDWFLGFVQAWGKTQPIRLQPAMSDAPEYVDGSVHGAPPDARQDEVLKALRVAWMNHSLNRKVYDTLTGGPEAADGYWKNPEDRSDVDFGCVKELINIGWTFPQIEEAWAFLPIGERYRDDRARNHGHGYLLRTYDNAKARWDKEQIDLQFAVGPDWNLMDGAEWWEEGKLKHFSFGLKNSATGKVHQIEVDGRAFSTPAAFKSAVFGQAAFIDLDRFADAKGLRTLALAIQRLATERQKPELATREGHLRFRIRNLIAQHAIPRVVSVGDDVANWLSWCDGSHVYVVPGLLHRYMQRAVTPSPSENEVWRQVQAMGGEEARWAAEYVWKAPASGFPDLRLS